MTSWFLGRVGATEIPFPSFAPRVLSTPHPLVLGGGWPDRDVRIRPAVGGSLVELGEIYRDASDYSRTDGQTIDALSQKLVSAPGSRTVVVADVAGFEIHTDPSGARPVYYRILGDSVWVSSSARVLATLAPSRVNPAWIVTWIAAADLPDLLADASAYEDVREVPLGHRLIVRPGGHVLVERWWTIPPPTLGLSDGADLLQRELTRSVEVRASVGEVSVDVSGGFDSSTLAALTRRAMPATHRLHTITHAYARESTFEDLRYAQELCSSMPNVDHTVVDISGLPEFLAPTEIPPADEPMTLALSLARFRTAIRLVGSRGSGKHVSGQAADALVEGFPVAAVAELVRDKRPIVALHYARRLAAGLRISPLRVLRHATTLSRQTYAEWLRAQAVSTVRPSGETLPGWAPPIRVPSWMTDHARTLLRDHLTGYLGRATPLADTAGQHATMSAVAATARQCRLIREVAEGEDVHMTFPFLDENVLSACLASHAADRVDPERQKPVLAEAFGDLMPPGFYERREKTSPWLYTRDFFNGARAHKDFLRNLFKDSVLVDLGLVDGPRMTSVVDLRDYETVERVGEFIDTVAAELWARTI